MSPKPDKGPTEAKTYTDPADPMSTDNVPPDDFEPAQRGGTEADPFERPKTPGSTEGTPPPAAQPMDDGDIPGAEPLLYSPVRQRTIVHARYRVPRVARLYVEPRSPSASESRLAKR